MGFSLKDIAIAGAVAGATLQGASALAQETNTPLTEEQHIAVNLVKEYNTCVVAENTLERAEAIRAYEEAVTQAEALYNNDYAEYRQAVKDYYEVYRRIAKENDIEIINGVPADYPLLSTTVEFAQARANQTKIHALVEAETGLTEPEYIGSIRDRIEALGDKPQRAVDICSDRISKKFFDAGLNMRWDLEPILNDIINEQGPEAYEALVTPEGP